MGIRSVENAGKRIVIGVASEAAYLIGSTGGEGISGTLPAPDGTGIDKGLLDRIRGDEVILEVRVIVFDHSRPRQSRNNGRATQGE